MKQTYRRLSKPTVFALLMIGAVLTALLPARWTGCADALLQPVSPLIWAVSTGTAGVRDGLEELPRTPPSPQQFAELTAENERLRRQVGHQHVRIFELEQIVAELTELRDQFVDLRAKIVIGRVVGRDASPNREMITIDKGSRQGIKAGDWVAAGLARDVMAPELSAQDAVLRQWLLGRVEDAQPYISRVQLATDPRFGTERAWVAKPVEDGTWQPARRQCGLIGVGNGRMRILQASENYLDTGYTVVLLPLSYPQPSALAVGRVVDAQMLETGLHFDLGVEPWGDPASATYVYVISLPE